MNIKHIQKCRICGNPHLTKVIDLGDQPFQGSFVKEGHVTNPPTRKTPNLIVRCDTSKFEDACGLIQTKHTIAPEILYSNYWYQSGISKTMRDHLGYIVKEALKITGISHDGRVLDIASNDNTLLRQYPCDVGNYFDKYQRHSNFNFTKVGVDPSDIAKKQTDIDIKVINTTFPTKELEGHYFDIITSIACFYDIDKPYEFVKQISDILDGEGIWIFEVAYWPSMLKNLAYDSIVNEHLLHYHLAPIEFLLKQVGLKVFRADKTTTNGGSIMVFACHDSCDKYDSEENKKRLQELRIEEFDAQLDEETTYSQFRNRVEEQRANLWTLIKDIKSQGKEIHIYGASTKLNTILGYCDIGPELIKYAAERSPDKWGAKTISGIELISEEASRAMKPDYYLVGPYHFKNEILEREKATREAGTKFIFPLPKVTIE